MNNLIIFQCSPRPDGINARLANLLIQKANLKTSVLFNLNSYNYSPCIGCNRCFAPPHTCIFDPDEATGILNSLYHASCSIFFVPIYFYSVPAHFKSLIDRGQKYWAISNYKKGDAFNIKKPAIIVLTAAREKGPLLFSGALRTIRWFLKSFNFCIKDICCLRGLENIEDFKPCMDSFVEVLSKKIETILFSV